VVERQGASSNYADLLPEGGKFDARGFRSGSHSVVRDCASDRQQQLAFRVRDTAAEDYHVGLEDIDQISKSLTEHNDGLVPDSHGERIAAQSRGRDILSMYLCQAR